MLPKFNLAHTVAAQHKDLNSIEAAVLRDTPMLQRMPSNPKPPVLTIQVPANHNPDFMIWRYFIEVKGYVAKQEWLKLLKHLPDELAIRYKVIVCCQRPEDRERLTQVLYRKNPLIEVADFYDKNPVQPWHAEGAWVREALADWRQCSYTEKQETIRLYQRYFNPLPPILQC